MISFCTKTAFLFVFVGTKVKKHLVLFIFNELPQLCALKCVCLCSIPGHFFNSEHSLYLFPMFNFKKHRSMHCELLCNQLYRTPEILK
jgi:hypothetical protein